MVRWKKVFDSRVVIAIGAAAALTLQLSCSPAPSSSAGSAPLPPVVAASTTQMLHVSPAGREDAVGTSADPFATLGAAAAAAQPGTLIKVGDGVYQGSLKTQRSGTAEARIVYQAENPGRAKIVGQPDVEYAWRNDGDFVDIIGFDISGPNAGGILETGSHVRVLNNNVHGFAQGSCITTYSQDYALTNVDIIGNTVHGCGSSSLEHGIYVGHTGGVVTDNLSYGNAGYGIHCWHNCNELTISNNVLFANGGGGLIIGQGDSPNFGRVPADNFIVANNIVVYNGESGIQETGATGNFNRFLNNLVFGNEGPGMDIRTGLELGTVTADPEFVNYQTDGSGDYHLRDSSPAIDAGTDVGGSPRAIDGTPRPQGERWDIGAYERTR